MLMRIRALLVLAVCVVGASSFADARQATAPASVLDALLVEVRSLRVAMEQMASAGPRVQLALGRLQLQEQRVNTLVRRLESIRAQITEMERMRDTLLQRNQQFDAAVRDEPPPTREDGTSNRRPSSISANLHAPWPTSSG